MGSDDVGPGQWNDPGDAPGEEVAVIRVDASSLQPRRVGTAAPTDGASAFAGKVADALREVNDLQATAQKGGEALARGEATSLPRLVADLEEASLAFQLTVQFRNKALEAYQDVMRMQI